jgi:hypothetical protein
MWIGPHLSASISERNRVQIMNYQAKTAVALKDQEQFCKYLIQGIQGAKMLGSQMRRQEAMTIYWQGREIWPNDVPVKNLAELFLK